MKFSVFHDDVFGKTAHIGDKVWVCDFYHDDVNNKPNRHIRPQQVLLTAPVVKPYYGERYDVEFTALGKYGEPMKKKISPVGNSYSRWDKGGYGISIFFDEDSCKDYYLHQCQEVLKKIKEARDAADVRYAKMEDEIRQAQKDYSI